MKIAILEDDETLALEVAELLRVEGHTPSVFLDGEHLVNTLLSSSFDLYVIDWNVPKINGLEVLKYIRHYYHSKSPVIFLSSNAGEDDAVLALKWGADDYCKKPIQANEFLARVSALGRRIGVNSSSSNKSIEIANYQLNPATHEILIDGEKITLSDMEFKLAYYMFSNLNSPISRTALLIEVWGKSEKLLTRTLDVHMTWIRKKLNLGANGKSLKLSAIYGYGYRLAEVFPEPEMADC